MGWIPVRGSDTIVRPAAETDLMPEPSKPAAHPLNSNRVLLGIAFMIAATTAFPFMTALAQILTHRYPPEQVVWARLVGHLIFVLLVFAPRTGWRQIFRTTMPITQSARSFVQVFSTGFYFSSVKFLELAQATTISFTTPFLVTMMAPFMLGEKLSLHRIGALVVGFLGVLIVIRPGSNVFQWAMLGILASTAFYALYQVLTRRVAGHDPPATTVVYSVLVGTIVLSFFVMFRWRTPDNMADAAMLCGIGVFGGIGHWCLAKAMTYAPANVMSPFGYWQLIGATVLGYLINDNLPDAFTWAGAAVIIGAGIYLGWRETRERRSLRASSESK
jgi:drug/metabolite transporter (DMT)-like permease